jgi:tRNA-specific 2-thiouridylase
MKRNPLTVAVAMSGGVDSLRTASLLKEQGYDVLGIHMRLLPASRNGKWCAETRIQVQEERLRALASRLNIPLTVVDLRKVFEEQVIRPFLKAYTEGLTPNPCVLCNPTVKFGLLWEKTRQMGAERIATGHYVKLVQPDSDCDRFRLYRATHLSKDQSYFLFGLKQEQLSRALFPLGDVSKSEILRWSRAKGLGSLLTQESQEICFIPSGHYGEFLQEHLNLTSASVEGPIIDMEGHVLGRHRGIFAYTIGQRRGLGIPSTAPYYVIGLDAVTNTVQVGRARDLYCREFKVNQVNWVSISEPSGTQRAVSLRAQVRIRNQHQPAPASITALEGGRALVCFDEPQRAVTPGQAAVFYDDDQLLGGGIISKDEV